MSLNGTELSKEQLNAIFNRHHGSKTQLAKDMGLAQASISNWLLGRVTSERIAKAATKRAKELLDLERKTAGKI